MTTSEPKVTAELAAAHGLSPDEWDNILSILGRTPTYPELGIFSVMWSEHCSYKSSKIHLKTFPTSGDRVLQGPGENAGVVDLGDGWAACFKMESHNHPSYIEPYQGAATGVGGILRDVFTMGARPVANLNSLHFGRPEHPRTPYLVEGVVKGIGDYGNCVGIPTVGGQVVFNPCYDGNILVNAFTLGILPSDRIFRGFASGPGNPVWYVGSKTGRDGIHGATMASAEFSEETEEKRPTVQVGDPFTEKLLLEACLELMADDVLVGIQDMGAAGLTSSSFEMCGRAGTGIRLDLDRVPQRETGMTPYEILLSESQERMLLVPVKGKEARVREIFAKWGLDAVEIGSVTDTGRAEITWGGETVVDIPIDPVSELAPEYDRPQAEPDRIREAAPPDLAALTDCGDPEDVLLRLLAHPDLCSRRWVWTQYDQTVRTNTVEGSGGDAAVIRIKGTKKAMALCLDVNPRYCHLDPHLGGIHAVAEAARNVSCTGAKPLAITDCLNFGNPEKPEVMWEFARSVEGIAEACRALETPVVSGNVSFYNETNGVGIHPTPTVGMLGLLEDVDRKMGAWFRRRGHGILLLGETRGHLGGSQYLWSLHGREEGTPPPLDLDAEKRLQAFMRRLAADGLCASLHDCSDGGLLVAAAECCLHPTEPVGATLTLTLQDGRLDGLLFGEDASRILVSAPPDEIEGIVKAAGKAGVPCRVIGRTGGSRLIVEVDGARRVDVETDRLAAAREGGFEGILRRGS